MFFIPAMVSAVRFSAERCTPFNGMLMKAPVLRYVLDGLTHPGFGSVTGPMFQALREFVQGKRVWALYSGGGLAEAHMLIQAGAAHVCAVDKLEHPANPKYLPSHEGKIVDCRAYVFEFLRDYAERAPAEVVFMKWPDVSLRTVGELDTAPHVIYIGRNDGMTACGSRSLWQDLSYRPVVSVIGGSRNDMVVYGPRGDAPASIPRCKEEVCAWRTWELTS
jgi:hypothetical protein